ncbi:glycosyltransferase [Fructobacillus sp. M1-13]|uniref:Glycosyltransferase n=1 Tax=Fructobacillus papyriferae TaxID=2713171 RepID=A0ABS5QNT8_9LACO|nr:glycosyltransferase [Fructobacillus papyriferae]MBS9334522.1 glycosyltransferase [Fructobacillus papyriferae]MCD2158511.1 glycosyltransferase [Fructobacillus papyriferae]
MNFFLNKGMGHSNSGVENAQFYRLEAFDSIGQPAKLILSDLLPKLHEHMQEWQLEETNVLNLYDYLMAAEPARYLDRGMLRKELVRYDQTTLSDFTKTNRLVIEQATSGYLIKRMKEKVWSERKQLFLVSDAQVELSRGDRTLSWSFRHVDGRREMTAIMLTNFLGQNYYFENFYDLLSFFLADLKKHFGKSNYFLDRGLDYDEYLVANRDRFAMDQLIAVVHADHRFSVYHGKKTRLVFNQFYQYLANHLSFYDQVVVSTTQQQKTLQRNLKDLGYDKKERDKVRAIPVGFVRSRASKTVISTKDDSRPLKLVTASRLHPEKHIDQLILAAGALKRKGVAFDFSIYGTGQEEERLKQLIEEQGLSGTVTLAGFCQDLPDVLKKADLYLSASYSEGFGLTYLEALAQGVPVVSYKNIYGAAELVQDGKSGFLVDFRPDKAAIADNVEAMVGAILQAKKQLASLSTGALKRAADFSKASVSTDWQRLLEEAHEV